ncbi:MAG TPA: S-methyl-5-thioribose-1-phosphate isomerase [Candidatus Bilamarchaeum sp.]|nr:S-methyl-5-thioribose-1-phosphate isomerase [Candidatus Bilamarchaeum sp.]
MHKDLKRTIRDIKSLKIQGARNVAKEALKALVASGKSSKAASSAAFLKEVSNTAEMLSASRPTEPMMRNILDEAVLYLRGKADTAGGAAGLKRILGAHGKETLAGIDEGAKRLAEYGARLIPDGALVLTHCHSSTSTKVMIEAKRMRKKFSVICFETRPRYQGRTTAAELAAAGIDVTLSVDGGMNSAMKKADIVIVGADSVTSRGDLINKIGTSTLAHIARMNDVSFYSAAELYKYSPMTIFGTREKIEERDHREVWDRPARGVKITNPAFEATAAKYINGYITELGVIPPQSFFTMASQKLGIKLYE